MPAEDAHQFRLRRAHPDPPRDDPVSTVEDIIRRVVDTVTEINHPQDGEMHVQLAQSQRSLDQTHRALEDTRLRLMHLEKQNHELVDTNYSLTRERDAWAEANAKFARRHEDNKIARNTLTKKLESALDELDEYRRRLDEANAHIAKLNGDPVSFSPPTPKTHSPPSSGNKLERTGSTRSIRGVERGSPRESSHQHRQHPYPPSIVEQSVLRERLTSDMFTLSQKVLEERAARAEEARAMAERRIFELESQLSRPPMNGELHSRPPYDYDRSYHHPGYPPPPPHALPPPPSGSHSRRESAPVNGSWVGQSPRLPPPPPLAPATSSQGGIPHPSGRSSASGPPPISAAPPHPPGLQSSRSSRDLEYDRYREGGYDSRDRYERGDPSMMMKRDPSSTPSASMSPYDDRDRRYRYPRERSPYDRSPPVLERPRERDSRDYGRSAPPPPYHAPPTNGGGPPPSSTVTVIGDSAGGQPPNTASSTASSSAPHPPPDTASSSASSSHTNRPRVERRSRSQGDDMDVSER